MPKLKTVLAGMALVAVALCAPFAASASPVSYPFDSGQVTLSATSGASFIAPPSTLPLDGMQVTVDTAALQLVSLELTATGPLTIALSNPYAGYDEVVIESLSLTGGPGVLVPGAVGPPAQYLYTISPLLVTATVKASGPAVPDIGSTGVLIDTTASGNLFISEDETELSLNGITLGVIGPFGNESLPIVVKGDFTFSSAPIPEPSATLLYSLGFATVAWRVRRNGLQRSNPRD